MTLPRSGGKPLSISILFALAALMLLVLIWPILRRVLKLLLFRAVGRAVLKEVGEKAIARQPDAIHLVAAASHSWKNAEVCDRLADALRQRGFVEAGIYTITEIPGVALRFLLNQATNSYASIYEHDKAGNWIELITRYQDGTGATFTQQPDRGMRHRVQDFVVHAPGADPGTLYERMLKERPQRALLDLNADELPRLFETVYAAQVRWRKQRGADVREVAKAVISLKSHPIGKGSGQWA
jgi:hypothetical protein